MRTLFIFLFILCYSFLNAQEYNIKGVTPGLKEGEIFLLAYNKTNIDTLGFSSITNEEFNIKGTISNPISSFLLIKGKRQTISLILEPTDIEVTINFKKRDINIKGGPNQEIMNKFTDLEKSLRKKEKVLHSQYSQARMTGDMLKAKAIKDKFQYEKKRIKEKKIKYIEKYNNSLASLIQLSDFGCSMEYDNCKKLFNNLSEDLKSSKYGNKYSDFLNRRKAITIGNIAPDFCLKDLNNKEVKLHSIKSKVKIIDFWAAWCGPCRRENQHMKNLYTKFKDKGLKVISVSLDKKKIEWAKAVGQDKLSWILVNAPLGFQSEVAKTYVVEAIPSIFVLDENNKIIATGLRGKKLEEKISELLQ